MDGEYQGAFPAELAIEHARVRKIEGPGEWIAKGFAPIPHGHHPGQGYNVWFTPEKVNRVMRFAGEVGASLIDGKPALMGYYAAFESHNSNNGMTNEVRKVEDGLYLGIISTNVDHRYWGPVDPSTGRGHPRPFVLRGPVGPWVGVDDPGGDPGL